MKHIQKDLSGIVTILTSNKCSEEELNTLLDKTGKLVELSKEEAQQVSFGTMIPFTNKIQCFLDNDMDNTVDTKDCTSVLATQLLDELNNLSPIVRAVCVYVEENGMIYTAISKIDSKGELFTDTEEYAA